MIAAISPIAAAVLFPGYSPGSGQLTAAGSALFVDQASIGGGDSTHPNGVPGWSAEITGIWNKGETVTLTGMALPIHATGTSSTTFNGTFSFHFYDLDQGAHADEFDGIANETLLGSATAEFQGHGSSGTDEYYVIFDTPISFKAASTGVAVHITNSASLRLKINSTGVLRRGNAEGTPLEGATPRFKMSLAGVAASAIQDFFWFGHNPAGDGVNLFSEQNWIYQDGVGIPPVHSINPGIAINRNLVISGGSPGGTNGAAGILSLGSGALSIIRATLKMAADGQSGIHMGGTNRYLTLTDAQVLAEFIDSGIVSLQGESELTLFSPTNPLPNGTTIDLQEGSASRVIFLNIPPSAVNSEHLGFITCNGQPSSEAVSVRPFYQGSMVMVNPAAAVIAFDLPNGQGQHWEYATGFWGKIADGTARLSGGTHVIEGMGDTVWSGHDEFTYLSREMTGNLELIIRLNSFSVTSGREGQAKAGIMLRESLDSLSRYTFLCADNTLRVRQQTRMNLNNNPSISPSAGTPDTPKWLRVARTANSVTCYFSEQGPNGPWTQAGSTANWASTASLFIGLAVNSYSHLPGTAAFDGVTLRQNGAVVAPSVHGAFSDIQDVRKNFNAGPRMSSFLLRRGYEAVLSQEVGGMGFSKVFIATEKDLLINLPPELDNQVAFMNVVPWRWTSRKGWGGAQPSARKLGAFWNYEWEPTGNSSADIEFVPMIKGRAQNKDFRWDEVRMRGGQTHFLGFNEPMAANQGDLTVDEAIALWPKAQAIGLRLGSPARTDGANGDQWLKAFMQKADARGYRVDYMCVHIYNQTGPLGLKAFLDAEYKKYGRPIWLTEFNRAGGDSSATLAQMKNYLNEVLPMLEALPYLERYAIFNFQGNSLFESDGELSQLGEIYRRVSSNPACTSPKTPPIWSIGLASPIDNSTIQETNVVLSASLPSAGFQPAKVEFFVNNSLAGVVTSPPWTVTATNCNPGLNYAWARATTGFGLSATSDSALFRFSPPAPPSTPAAISVGLGEGGLRIDWPATHTGWLLQVQTNSLGTNWTTLSESESIHSMVMPIDSKVHALFFRLVRP